MDFLVRELPDRLREARQTLARFVGADPEGLVFVPNATTGVNAVVRSLDLRAGDEILTTDHVYAAWRKALLHAAMRSGGRVVMAPVPFPVDSDDAIVEAVLAGVTPRTRLALIDHVTSPTALIVPVARLARELEARGVESTCKPPAAATGEPSAAWLYEPLRTTGISPCQRSTLELCYVTSLGAVPTLDSCIRCAIQRHPWPRGTGI